jgi:hypothetical protein
VLQVAAALASSSRPAWCCSHSLLSGAAARSQAAAGEQLAGSSQAAQQQQPQQRLALGAVTSRRAPPFSKSSSSSSRASRGPVWQRHASVCTCSIARVGCSQQISGARLPLFAGVRLRAQQPPFSFASPPAFAAGATVPSRGRHAEALWHLRAWFCVLVRRQVAGAEHSGLCCLPARPRCIARGGCACVGGLRPCRRVCFPSPAARAWCGTAGPRKRR